MKKRVLFLILSTAIFNGCSFVHELEDVNTIYPCTIGCGNEKITPPKGYVYYNHRIMSLQEFNRITNQHIVMQ